MSSELLFCDMCCTCRVHNDFYLTCCTRRFSMYCTCRVHNVLHSSFQYVLHFTLLVVVFNVSCFLSIPQIGARFENWCKWNIAH
jgi:hypothetical protein